MGALEKFAATFPTATILYVLLVLFVGLEFEWAWLAFAVIIDVLDDFAGNAM